MTSPLYPLAQVLEVKIKRVEDAERVVREKKELLVKEEEKLKQREEERQKVRDHYDAKLKQMRDEMDQGTTTDKIQQMKVYLKVVQDKLKIEDKKVADQKEQVKIAEKNVEEAKKELLRKRTEVDKLQTHRKDWLKEMRKELDVIEGREQDELGTTIFTTNQRRRIR